MEEAAQLENYLMQQMPSLDSQNRKILLRPVSATQMMRSSWLKARPVGAERHLRAIDRMLCCCMSITKRDPLVFDATFSPKAPQSVKKMFPVVFERRSECGPSRGAPSYSFTSSVYCESLEREMMDCLSRSVRQQQLLALSQATARTCPLTFANSLSWPSRYFIISPLKEQNTKASSVSKGEQSGEFTSRIFQELVSEKNITKQVIIIFKWQGGEGGERSDGMA